MKRKLINYDVFERMQKDSLSSAQNELVLAEDVISKALDRDCVQLLSFGESDVTYETSDGTYIHATYQIKEGRVVFENIEELVVEEESEQLHARSTLESMVDSLLDENDAAASAKFSDYLNSSFVRRKLKNASLNESALTEDQVKVTVSKPTGKQSPLKNKRQNRGDVAERIRKMKITKRRRKAGGGGAATIEKKADNARNKLGGSTNKRWRVNVRKVKPSTMAEWATMCEHIGQYVDYKEFGPVLKESVTQHDERGNVVGLSLPNSHRRNEGKILSFNWKTLDHEVKVLRAKVKTLHENNNFVRAMADLKRFNNISDDSALQETLENIVSAWPDLIYLSQDELSQSIHLALETGGVKNYDDQVCNFMAEGILRTAHHAYRDRVQKISSLAGASPTETTESSDNHDAYAKFQEVVSKFYPTLDESDETDLRVFHDLYSALHEIYQAAYDDGDELMVAELANYLHVCESVLNRERLPDVGVAAEITEWLRDLVETNLAGHDWGVSNDTHMTLNGDHPRMAQNAKHGYTPSSDLEPNWGGIAPVSDGKSYRGGLEDEMRNRSWSNIGGSDTYPDLKNPYVPAPFGKYTIKGEVGAEEGGTDDWSRWQSGDTWPKLQNPYVPSEAGGTGGTGYKMKSDNLVVDK